MHSFRKSLLAAAGVALIVGSGAYAASRYTHHLQVSLPDGEVAQVDYVGDVAPRVVVQPVAQVPIAAVAMPGFGSVDAIFADMERQRAAMMQQVAQMQAQLAAHPGGVPASDPHAANGGVHWSYVSTSTTSNGCTRTVEWHSGGAAANGAQPGQPQVIRTSSGTCDKAVGDTPVHPVSDVKPQAPTPAGRTI